MYVSLSDLLILKFMFHSRSQPMTCAPFRSKALAIFSPFSPLLPGVVHA